MLRDAQKHAQTAVSVGQPSRRWDELVAKINRAAEEFTPELGYSLAQVEGIVSKTDPPASHGQVSMKSGYVGTLPVNQNMRVSLRLQFDEAGDRVLSLSADMPDAALLLAVMDAVSFGRRFVVVPEYDLLGKLEFNQGKSCQ